MQGIVAGFCRDDFIIRATATFGSPEREAPTRKRLYTMFRQPKYRQASLIVLATAVILILPNIPRLFS